MPQTMEQIVGGLSPTTTAAMREDLSAYRADYGAGDTDLDFEMWLKTTRPQRYKVFLELEKRGKQL